MTNLEGGKGNWLGEWKYAKPDLLQSWESESQTSSFGELLACLVICMQELKFSLDWRNVEAISQKITMYWAEVNDLLIKTGRMFPFCPSSACFFRLFIYIEKCSYLKQLHVVCRFRKQDMKLVSLLKKEY